MPSLPRVGVANFASGENAVAAEKPERQRMTSTTKAARACDFLVRRGNLHECAWFDAPDPATVALAPGQVLLAVDAFAFTANNITHAVFGDTSGYWRIFPAREGWGTVPVWGFAVVVRSAHSDITVGERIYGPMPMSTHFVVEADDVTAAGFTNASAKRRELAAIYFRYVRANSDASYEPAREAEQMLWRGLFMHGYLIDDFLADADFFGARSVIVSSASSKTAIALAFWLLRRGREACELLGLTSRTNQAFVEGLGCYHRVATYDDIASLPATTPTIYMDIAGNGAVTSAVHQRFGDRLRYDCSLGFTHLQNLASDQEFPGPRPEVLRVSSRLSKRLADWGPVGLQKRLGEGWPTFVSQVSRWITIDRASGRAAIERVYQDTLDGRIDPGRGCILSF